MLSRLFHGRWIVCPPVLLTLVCSFVWWPVMAKAQTQPTGSKGSSIILVIPAQKTADVPDSVASNVEQNLKALMEIDSSLKLLLSEQRDPGPEFAVPVQQVTQAEDTIKPVMENPSVAVARASLEKARELVRKKSWEGALSRLMKVKDTFAKYVGDTDDFSGLLDSHILTALSFINGGFNEEGATAIRALLTIKPDFDASSPDYSDRFRVAVDKNRDKVTDGGELIVRVEPADAVVYVDGRLIGRGTQVVSGLKRGKHYVRVTGETSFPAGNSVTTNAPGSPTSLSFNLKSRIEKAAPVMTKAPEVKSGPRPLVWYAKTGLYNDQAFNRDVKSEAQQVFADYVLFSFYARSNDKFHIGAFVAHALSGEIVAVKPAVVNLDLGNLYVELLDLEKRISTATTEFQSTAKITAQPEIYRMVQAKPKPVPVPVPVQVQQQPVPAPVQITQNPVPVKAPTYVPADFPLDLPSDYPVATKTDTTATQRADSYVASRTTVTDEPVIEQKTPIYKKWWLWTIVGVVVTGAVVGGVMGHFCQGGSCDFGGGPADVSGGIRW